MNFFKEFLFRIKNFFSPKRLVSFFIALVFTFVLVGCFLIGTVKLMGILVSLILAVVFLLALTIAGVCLIVLLYLWNQLEERVRNSSSSEKSR